MAGVCVCVGGWGGVCIMSHKLFYLTQKCRAVFGRWMVQTPREEVDKLRAELLMFQKSLQP